MQICHFGRNLSKRGNGKRVHVKADMSMYEHTRTYATYATYAIFAIYAIYARYARYERYAIYAIHAIITIL